MSNAITAFNPQYWAAEMQVIFFKENVAIALANTELRDDLLDGYRVHKPYRSKPQAVTYSKGTDITTKDRFAVDEYLDVDTAKVVPFYVDDLDKIQNKWNAVEKFAADGQRLLNNILDQIIAGEVANAAHDIDDGDVGGTAGNNITLGTSNVSKVCTAASRELDGADAPQVVRFALIGPRFLEILRLYLSGKDTPMADIVGKNGKVMERFGFEIFYSNNCYFTAVWTPANIPSAGDYIEINGARIEFVADADVVSDDASLGVLVEADTETTLEHLEHALNDIASATEVVGTDYSDPDAENDAARWKLIKAGIVAVATATYITITGYGDIVVSASESADVWSAQEQDVLFGVKGATDLVVQKTPSVEFRMAEKRLGRYVYPWMYFGKKTFTDMTEALVKVKLNASAWT